MDKIRHELLQGTLDLLILRTLCAASLHGWDIAKRIAIVSNDRLSLKQGSLYPALHRLEGRGWVEAEWGVSDAGRSAKFYRITRAGRKQLEAEKAHWLSFVSAMTSVLNMDAEEGSCAGCTGAGCAMGTPADLGYFIGFRIAQIYCRRASDKKQAIRDILTSNDVEKILAESRYGVRW